MDENRKTDIALFKYKIISPLISGIIEDKNNSEFFALMSSKKHQYIDGTMITISGKTVERWYYQYKKNGIEGLKPLSRDVSSLSFRCDKDIVERIKTMKTATPRIPASEIQRRLIEEKTIGKDDLSLSTINRIVNKVKSGMKLEPTKEMFRYERAHINEVWCGDSSVGPYLYEGNEKTRLWVIALLDDCSRMIVGIGIFRNDNCVNLVKITKKAIAKYGKPNMFNFDNGSTYKNKQIELISARIGTAIHYCAPYEPTGKSKIERFFRTMKDHWMTSINYKDFKSLEAYEKSLEEYANKYNNTIHSALTGLTPMERFTQEIAYIKRLGNEGYDDNFLFEIKRKVSIDNVLKIDNEEFETPSKFSKKKVTIRYSPSFETCYVIDENGECNHIKKLDKKSNSKRKRIALSEVKEDA